MRVEILRLAACAPRRFARGRQDDYPHQIVTFEDRRAGTDKSAGSSLLTTGKDSMDLASG